MTFVLVYVQTGRTLPASTLLLSRLCRQVFRKSVQIDTDERALVALYDERLDTVRVFDREKDGEALDITYESGEGFVDDQGRTWSAEGESKDLSLDWVESFDVFWFAWHAFFPDADIYK